MITSSIIILAILIDLIFSEPPNAVHPVAWMGNYIGCLWEKRPSAKPAGLFLFGLFICLSGMIIFSLPMFAAAILPFIPRLIIQSFLLKFSFSLRKLFSVGRRISEYLKADDIEGARHLTSFHLVSRPTETLDREKIAAAVIGSVSENITDSLVSPLLYFAAFGLPAAWAYRYVNTCDAMIGYRKEDCEWGGKFPARLDDIINFIPARLTAIAIILTSLPSGNIFRVLRNTIRWQKITPGPNSGWTMAAMAAVLDVRLEKVDYYILNAEGRAPSEEDIIKCIKKSQAAFAIIIITILLVSVLYGFF